ncbi:MAG: SRPBCC family protein [Stellaceae bacterium]
MTRSVTIAPVRKSLRVAAPQAIAFSVFTAGIDRWWPRKAHIGKSPMAAAIIEPFAGGRWYHRCEDGSDSAVGHVLVWQPPERLVLAWQISNSCVDRSWQYDASLVTEVEVQFIAEGAGETRVEFEHRHLDRLGDGAEAFRTQVDGGWGGILEGFAAQAAREAQGRTDIRQKEASR